ncbi:MAG: TetR/AcrR family transcriptional regulator [Slackia sp.]|nr:TetR/AcrR family transcriptional regulator [Slackia sp.]
MGSTLSDMRPQTCDASAWQSSAKPAAGRRAVSSCHGDALAGACDPRIARSRAALREALIELMEERGLDGFTVGDLCAQAGLNRGTFYNHFKDKDDLLQTFEDEVLADLDVFSRRMRDCSIRDLIGYRVRKKPFPVLVDLFDYVREEGPFFHAVLGPGGDMRFAPRLRAAVCNEFILSLLHERYREDPTPFVNYYVAYFAGAYLSVILRWIETGMHESSEEMALIAVRLFFIKPGESITL